MGNFCQQFKFRQTCPTLFDFFLCPANHLLPNNNIVIQFQIYMSYSQYVHALFISKVNSKSIFAEKTAGPTL